MGRWTYAAVGWASRSFRQHRYGRDGSEARTSSGPQWSRRRERSRCSCHHRIVCGSRRRKPGPCWTCTGRQASHGARPWRRWRGWGAERPYHLTSVSSSNSIGSCVCPKNPQFHLFLINSFFFFVFSNPFQARSKRIFPHPVCNAGVERCRRRGLTRPSACGQAEGCG